MKKETITVEKCEALILQWDWKLNNQIGLKPDSVSIGSQKKAFWICEKHGETYQQVIRARHRGETGCSQCKVNNRENMGRERYIQGKAVLSKTHPELVEEWVQSYKAQYTPDTCLAGSNLLVKWKCKKCGGEYDAYVSNRAIKGSGCPYCAGQKALSGYNDLKTLAPDLAAEWSDKNLLSPTEVTVKSNKKVYWVCKLGHDDYLTSVKLRSNGQGCPECAKRSHTSFPEQALFFYVKKEFSDAINRYDCEGREIDIFVPSIKVGIEYNGIYYHKGKGQKDKDKRLAVEKLGIRLITVSEVDRITDFISESDRFFVSEYYDLKELSELIGRILSQLKQKIDFDVDCERDRILINEQYINSVRENSVATIAPEIVGEWDCKRNGRIKPEYVSYGSHEKYYWICRKCKQSYLATTKDRVNGRACPYCAGKKIVKGVNDLESRYPALAQEWDYDKNGDITPDMIACGSGYKAWWICGNGHSWNASVNNRTSQNNACPYCYGRLPIKGENDLATTHPSLAKEWDYEKNDILPQDVKAGTNRKVWWICAKKHSFQQAVSEHTGGKGCPYCSNLMVWKGFNDLQTKNPALAAEWDYDKNVDLTPDKVTNGTHRKVWWKCPKCGHSWLSQVVNRNSHTGCPKCHHKYWS